jgi:glycosyltransferase involved in cell wall biosynthesis
MTRWLVIPCFNEAKRLDDARILSYASALQCNVLLVNDSSTDNTQSVIESIAESARGTVHAFTLPHNVGKAEAVRAGLQWAISHEATEVGYTDADGAVGEYDLAQIFSALTETPSRIGVIGSRVALLGRNIDRTAARHFTGRVFATFASIILQQPIYDTQCGAKAFTASTQLQRALSRPFVSRWCFDVELLGRLFIEIAKYGQGHIIEFPLHQWRDVSGSKIGFFAGIKTLIELLPIRRSLRQWARRPH